MGSATEGPASLAKFCANKPIHFIVTTLVFASLTWLAVFDHYISKIHRHSNTLTFYHPPDATNASQWDFIVNVTAFELNAQESSNDTSNYGIPLTSSSFSSLPFNSTPHWALTPVLFKADSLNADYPSDKRLIPGPDSDEKFYISKYTGTITAEDLPESFTNEDGEVFKVRASTNRVGRYYEYVRGFSNVLTKMIQGAEPFDIILVVLAYVAMIFTIAQLFYQMRATGSNFWLAFGSLLSSLVAFLFALAFTTEILGIDIPLSSISEGMPFLVAALGFGHKIAYTKPAIKEIQEHPDEDISTVIEHVVNEMTGWPLVKEQLILSGSFLLVALLVPNMPPLRNFCILLSVLMIADAVSTFTFYSAVISLKAQITTVHRQVELRRQLEEDGVDQATAKSVAKKDVGSTLFTHDKGVVGFKVSMVTGLIAVQLFALATSWLYDDYSDYTPSATLLSSAAGELAESIAGKVPLGENGTLVTLLPVKIYRRVTWLTQAEDAAFDTASNFTRSIRDPYVSKFILVVAGISLAVNAYLLNVTSQQLKQDQLKQSKLKASHKRVRSKANSSLPSSPVAPKTPKSPEAKEEPKLQPAPQLGPVSSNAPDNVKVAQIISDDVSSTEDLLTSTSSAVEEDTVRELDQLVEIMKAGNIKDECNDSEVVELCTQGKLPLYALEKQLDDTTRAVVVRRRAIAELANAPVLTTTRLPYKHYDYERVFGACCENVIGYMPLPVGVAGPLIIDGVPYHIPMATTEGCLVASTMRGCKALNAGGGVQTVLTADGMTRGPCVRFPTLARAGACKMYLDSEDGAKAVKNAFNSTSRFARLQSIKTAMAGTLLFMRFKTTTGDAMGMNMISKGVEQALNFMQEKCGFDDMDVISLSGNYCTDKKPAAINWIEGRGKSVVACATVPGDVVKKVLKSDVDALVSLNIDKNLVGSAMAGSIGGNNAQAANLVTAVYLACGQDPAQNVESSNCITLMDKKKNGDLEISVSMPSIEVGTIGGGTILEAQSAMLDLLGVRGPHPTEPGANSRQLAKVVASAVLAAELSLCSALAAGHLVRSHMQHNRKPASKSAATPTPAEAPATAAATNTPDVKRLQDGSKICIKS